MKLYHFTSLRHLSDILASGVLRPSDSMIEFNSDSDPRVVWLLDSETVDYSHGLYLAPESNPGSEWDKTRVRFTVDVPAVHWLDWAPGQAMLTWWRDVMIEAGGGNEAADHWWVFPAPIQRRRWLEITLDGKALAEEAV